MKILKKIVLYALAAVLVFILAMVASVFLFKDNIIRQFIIEANKHLSTPIKIGGIDVSALQDFPNLAIVLTDVYIEDSHPGEFALLTARKISFELNPWEVWQGKYTIHGLEMNDSETNLRINRLGVTNYTIVKSSGNSGTVTFNLNNVHLRRTHVTYTDDTNEGNHVFSSQDLTASIDAVDDLYHIAANGDVTIGQIGIGDAHYFRDKTFDIAALLDYNDDKKSIVIMPSVLKEGGALFDVDGTYDFKDDEIFDLNAKGKDADIRSLLSIFPATSVSRFTKYESRGEVYFDMKIKGALNKKKAPLLTVSFGFRNVTLVHPRTQSVLEKVNLEGSFATPSLLRLNNAVLSLKGISAILNGDSVSGNFYLTDFESPYIKTDFHGEIGADNLLKFYPIDDVSEISGRISANVTLTGEVSLLKDKTTAQQVKTDGTVVLKDLSLRLGKQGWHFKNLEGGLQFNNNDLAMSDLRGKFENSDFLLNGFFKNVVTFLIFDNQPIGIEADLKSDFLDVDQLFAIGYGSELEGPYKFSISPNLNLNFNCDVKRLKYKRFHPTDVKGDLLVKGQVAVSRNIKLNGMGGSLSLSGIVDAKNPKAIDLISSASLKDIDLDTLFYVFENFRQDFIGYHQLKGKTVADISMEATLHEDLSLFPETLIADVSLNIKKGELNQFAPILKLGKYLDDEGLSKLRFGDLKNDIHIENKTVYIPQMEVNTNVTSIQISGTHTFDQHINYRLMAPLNSKKKIDPDEAYGSIEEDYKGRSKIFLKIIGTSDNYEVTYDTDAVRKKIGSDFKKEVQDLKNAFKLKGKKKKKEIELEKDDYFDWENN